MTTDCTYNMVKIYLFEMTIIDVMMTLHDVELLLRGTRRIGPSNILIQFFLKCFNFDMYVNDLSLFCEIYQLLDRRFFVKLLRSCGGDTSNVYLIYSIISKNHADLISIDRPLYQTF